MALPIHLLVAPATELDKELILHLQKSVRDKLLVDCLQKVLEDKNIGDPKRSLPQKKVIAQALVSVLQCLSLHPDRPVEEQPADRADIEGEEDDDEDNPLFTPQQTQPEPLPCPDLKRGQCKFGFKGVNKETGEKCKFLHKKICPKFLKNGRFRGGCSKKAADCPSLHIRLCRDSYNYRRCYNHSCQMRHLPRTMRERDQPPTQTPRWPIGQCQTMSVPTATRPLGQQNQNYQAPVQPNCLNTTNWPAPSPWGSQGEDRREPTPDQDQDMKNCFLSMTRMMGEMQRMLLEVGSRLSR
jgi:hypothetical protein